MQLKQKVYDTLISLSIHGGVNTVFYIVLHSIATLQILSTIIQQDSLLHKIIFWVDPTNSIGTQATIIIATVVILLAFLSLIILLKMNKGQKMIKKQEGCYFSLESIYKYLIYICHSIILLPLIRSTIMELRQPSNKGSMILGAITSMVALLTVFVPGIFLAVDTSVIYGQLDRKVIIFTPPFLLIIFRPLLAISSTTSPILTLILTATWIFLFTFSTLRSPISCFQLSKFMRASMSAVTFCCLLRLSNTIFSTSGNLPLELLGLVCFLPFIEELTNLRVKYIMKGETSVRQTKLLLFFTAQLSSYRQFLQKYIFQHYKTCKYLQCKCKEVIDSLISKDIELKEEKIWYSFLVSHVEYCYDLEKISKLPRSKMEEETEQYLELVYDLAEIRIVKLQELGNAYSSISNFSKHLEKHNLINLWQERRYRKILFLLQGAIQERCRGSSINVPATTYFDYQETIGQYFDLLIETAEQAKIFWSQMGHRQPFEAEILKASIKIQSQNHRISHAYQSLTTLYPQSVEVIEEVTQDYFHKILNILPNDSIYPLATSESRDKSEKKKIKRLSEDMDAFSQNSETPMFIISIEPNSLGKIIKGNRYFEMLSQNYLGSIESIDDLIIPEMQSQHHKNVREAIQKDKLSYTHQNGFILVKKGKLMGSNILVQVIPSVSQGLRYAVFLKQLQPSKRIVAVKDMKQIIYSSDSFERLTETSFSYTQFLQSLSNQFHQENENKFEKQYLFSLTIAQEQFNFTLIHRYQDEVSSINFYEISFKQNQQRFQKDNNSIFSLRKLDGQRMEGKVRPREKTFFLMRKSKDFEQQEEREEKQKEMELGSFTVQKQQKNHKKISQMFKIILAETKGKNIAKISCIIPCITGFIIIALLISCIVAKKQNQSTFYKAEQNSLNYYKLMNRIAQNSIDLKMLNLKINQGQDSSQYYQKVVEAPSIKDAMDDFLAYFDMLEQVDEAWTTLKLQENKTFTL